MTSPFRLESPTAESVRGQMDSWCRGQMDYWEQVREAGFFDLEEISVPQGTTGLMPFYCDINYPHPVLVKRYARLGLDRYNMSHGTNLQLHHLKKFNKTMNYQASYYITLAACDQASIDPASLVTLQVGVAEGSTDRCCLNLSCFIAKPQGTPTDLLRSSGMVDDDKVQLPCWPSDFNDTQRFYEFKESELQSNDWIRLYLELALCANDRGIKESELSQLQIVKVVMETLDEPLQASAANVYVYITFKGFALARVGEIGEHVVRKVIVRRAFNDRTGCLTAHGGYGFSIGEVAEEHHVSRPGHYTKAGALSLIPDQDPSS